MKVIMTDGEPDVERADRLAEDAALCLALLDSVMAQRRADLEQAQREYDETAHYWDLARVNVEDTAAALANTRRAAGLVLTASGYAPR
jgi:hypothetical protein